MRPIPRRHRGNGSGAAPARHAAGRAVQGPRRRAGAAPSVTLCWVDDDVVILAAGALLAAGLGASLLAGRLRVPALVLFLGVGMALGSDAVGLISFSDYELARFLGTTALAMILFEGGLAAGWRVIRPVLAPALSLALVGTLVTAIVTGLAAAWLLDLSTLEGLLLGSILSATDGAAIFAVLRGSTLRRRLAHVLEGEAGFNDPVAVLLVVGFIEWIQTDGYGIPDMALLFVEEMAIGAAVGLICGRLAVWALRRVELASAGLYPVLTLGVAALAFGGAATGARLWLPRRLHRGSHDRRRAVPGQAHDRRVPRGDRVALAGRDVPDARAARLPRPARLRRARGHGDRARSRVRGAADRDGHRAHAAALQHARTGGARLGGPARRRPGRPRHVPDHRGGHGVARGLRHRLLRRDRVDGASGHDVPVAGGRARRDERRARAAEAARRERHDPRARRSDPRIPRLSGRRGRRRTRAGARPLERRARQRDRAPRRGGAAARHDAARGRRRASRPRARLRGPRDRRHRRALARRADRASAPRRAVRASRRLDPLDAPVVAGGRRPRAAGARSAAWTSSRCCACVPMRRARSWR